MAIVHVRTRHTDLSVLLEDTRVSRFRLEACPDGATVASTALVYEDFSRSSSSNVRRDDPAMIQGAATGRTSLR